MIKKISFSDLIKLVFLILIFLWFQNYAITNILGSVYSRAIEGGLFFLASFCLIKSKRLNFNKVVFLFFIFYLLLIVLGYFHDSYSQYKDELYFKTIGYLLFCVYVSYAFSNLFDSKDSWCLFIRVLGLVSFFSIVVFFLYAYLYMSWRPGSSMLSTSLGQYYQGLSRGVGLSLLLLVMSLGYVSRLLIVIGAVLSILIIISFNSMGALFSILLVFLYIIIKNKDNKKFILLSLFCFSFVFAWFLPTIMQVESIDMITSRASDKLSVYNTYDSRVWLMLKGIELWQYGGFFELIFGSGPVNYSKLAGYFNSYRHPHNLFVLLLTWFGLFSIPCVFFILKYIYLAIVCFLKNNMLFYLSGLLIYFFLLSLVGGDIEQNRHFIFLLFSFYTLYRNRFEKVYP